MLLLNGDCLELMQAIPDKSVDLILTDPPYNIGKAKWDKIPNYIEWCGKWFKECERLLKDNGSFYFWHNDMPQIAQLMEWIRQNTRFVFKQMIVWNKRFDKASNKGFLDGFVMVDALRNYQQMCEYCLFYTFQDETGLSQVMGNYGSFESLKRYFVAEKTKIENDSGTRVKDRLKWTTHFHSFAQGQSWGMCTEENYKELQAIFPNYFKRPYADIHREYESLRQEYENLRYTFNGQKTHHSVWNYETAPKQGHITPKPVAMLENILRHSSNEGDTVLDCFMGSGSTGVACVNTNRNFIGIELDEGYYNIAQKRIEQARTTGKQMILTEGGEDDDKQR